MIVSVCVATVACAPRWRRLGFNDCKGSAFGEKHQTAKGKVTSHAQPKRPSIQPQACPAPAIPEPQASSMPEPQAPSPKPQACLSIQPPPPLSKAKPSHPAKGKPFRKAPCKRKTHPPHESHFRAHICARQEPPRTAKNRQAPAKPPPPKNPKSALPSKEERSKISIGPHRLSGSAKHLGYLSNLRALKQA